MKLNNITKPVPIPESLCWPKTPDQLDAGDIVFVVRELPGDRLEVMTLAGPMVVNRSDTDWKGEQ